MSICAAQILNCLCPLWVRSMSALPLKAHIGQRNSDVRFVPKADIPRSFLFDQFVGAAEQRHWNSEAERLGSLKVDDQLEFGRSLNRQIGRLVAF
jgi:hypothetical protein